ncbi:MBL fold metallo-hydrolase [Aeromonas caviae]|uniref:MBL fold metallo-hydrolase n=1 Tax=Aeromonas caviae TaxID=648 RepID=UPI0030157F14
MIGMIASLLKPGLPEHPDSSQYQGGRFNNAVTPQARSLWEGAGLWWDFLFAKPEGTVPDRAIPVQVMTREGLIAAPDNSVWRLGHSTLLLKLQGTFWLTDPVFSERASPVQWFGPKRWHQPPITLEALPPIEGVILSHDHYDHLDHGAILALQEKIGHFITPLGVGARLMAWGIAKEKIRELDWWQQTRVGGVTLVATPAQHFSGRGLGDGNQTLWASWVIRGEGVNLFFSGDSGYFDGFKEIGRRYGPFDVTFLETGAYDKRWELVHMLPAQTAQAFHDLGGKWLYPVHNGTFDLAMHRWNDPLEQIARLAAEQQIPLTTPVMGEPLEVLNPHEGSAWWRD